jgi:peptide/nickel transport system permease protein
MNATTAPVSRGFWSLAWGRFRADRVGMVSLAIVAIYLIVVALSATGLVAKNWDKAVGVSYAPPDFWGLVHPKAVDENYASRPTRALAPLNWNTTVVDPLAPVLAQLEKETKFTETCAARKATLPLGGDRWGRDVLEKTVKGSQTSILVGLISALFATLIGTFLGALAGYYGRFVDDALNWVYNVFNAIPYLLLILAIAAVLQQRGVLTIVLIFGLTGWTGVFRLIRAEYMKHRGREYVLAARAFGVGSWRIMFKHILPNVSHIVLVEISLLCVGFIKSEVILSFLGYGVSVDEVSWGSMLNEAQTELIMGRWWELASATVAMAILVTAFSLLTDSMRDALDPKTQGGAR